MRAPLRGRPRRLPDPRLLSGEAPDGMHPRAGNGEHEQPIADPPRHRSRGVERQDRRRDQSAALRRPGRGLPQFHPEPGRSLRCDLHLERLTPLDVRLEAPPDRQRVRDDFRLRRPLADRRHARRGHRGSASLPRLAPAGNRAVRQGSRHAPCAHAPGARRRGGGKVATGRTWRLPLLQPERAKPVTAIVRPGRAAVRRIRCISAHIPPERKLSSGGHNVLSFNGLHQV